MVVSGRTADGSSVHLTNSTAVNARAMSARLPRFERGIETGRTQRVRSLKKRDVEHLVRPVPRSLREQFWVSPVVPDEVVRAERNVLFLLSEVVDREGRAVRTGERHKGLAAREALDVDARDVAVARPELDRLRLRRPVAAERRRESTNGAGNAR
jgi:hypothetical protein